MSVREEDRKKSGCPSRGVAIAATALGVGLGAAFYYLFNKRQETPNSEGSSSHWNDEPPPFLSYSDDSYTTISENETTDTSMNSQSESSSDTSRTNSDFTTDDYSTSDSEMVDSDEFSTSRSTIDMDELSPDNTSADISQDGDWDVTRSSAGLPTLDESIRSSVMVVFENVRNVFSPRVEKRNYLANMDPTKPTGLSNIGPNV
ncbi:unnamed protein product [Chrysodeixis includens]|uniref:Uncharacterized protein n=1 Tax=Chrysodeixis includens TaxID=689277 RepID=A0A9N8L0S7_CHRIL|nr:unnamed protein product [Chrysodeixis includens]